ncbi:hypothetical protein F7734_47815 [Scytonema sp. UIC 10036]|uniref:hypothetical protein n=1 Tax=Scytonema sp. UIC 10036 TaxID=2304196 RepID=UPI0012DA67BE|nr:hypothetical protein [Scytonema sp. UIC 10036]MUG99585.1 hypothetical protein [Scytonema sp. UIC 10036]
MNKKFLTHLIVSLLVGTGLQPVGIPVEAETIVKKQHSVSQFIPLTPNERSHLELLSLGAYPRKELRFQPTVNTKQTVRITIQENIVMPISERSGYTWTPPKIAVVIELLVTQVDANGDIHCHFTFKSVEASEKRIKYEKIKNFEGSATFNNRGQIIKTSLEQSQNLEKFLTYLLQKMTVFIEQFPFPFPAQAVGEGAQWRVTSLVNVDKIALTQIATYKLLDFKNNVATVSINLQQLPQQAIPSEETRNSSQSQDSLFSDQYQTSGSGKAIIELNKLVPKKFNTSTHNDTYFSKKVVNSPEHQKIFNNPENQSVIILRELSLQSK